LALPIAFFFGFAFVVLLLAFGESNLQLYFTAGVMNIQRDCFAPIVVLLL
jgi:hypothetical protein